MKKNEREIKKLFPDIVFYEIIELDSKKYIKLKTKSEWDKNKAIKFQTIILDRNPLGYGGPFNFNSKKIEKELFLIEWNFYNISD